MPAGRLGTRRNPSADAAGPALRAEPRDSRGAAASPSSSAQGHSVPSERASGGMGKSDGSSPYKDCQMRLKKAGRLAMPITVLVSSRRKPNTAQTAVAAVV